MDNLEGPAAPGSGTPPHHDPLPQVESEQTVADLTADPEIAALLDFDPVPRKIEVAGGWTPDKQREFIARLAVHGSPNGACDEMGMHRTGVTKLYKSPFGASFRESWHGAVALATSRQAQRAPRVPISGSTVPPSLDHRFKDRTSNADGPLPGQVLNEFGEWEDEDSYARRGEEAIDSIRAKLVRARRLYLGEISSCPGKRAAFEILTELPVDWDKAAKLEPQPFEPWTRTNQRQPDMLLTAESGWSFGEWGYGPDKKAEARRVLNEIRVERGLEPIDWGKEE